MVAMQSTSDAPDFARRQLQQRHRAFARNQLRLRARRTRHLRAFAGPQFDVVDDGAGGMFLSGSALPTRMSASGPDDTVRPDSSPSGAMM